MDNNTEEQAYLELVKECIEYGDYRLDRTKVGTYSLFGKRLEFDLSKNSKDGKIIPLLTTKKVMVKSVLKELLWIMKGQTDSKELDKNKVKIWNSNGSRQFLDNLGLYNRAEGDLGPIYGFQWRYAGANYIDCNTDYSKASGSIDQLKEVVEKLKHDQACRRIIICSWNVPQLKEMVLPPCHCLVQFYVRSAKDQKSGVVEPKKYLDCQLYQRSADLGLGVPFNIASYSFLMYVLCKWCNLSPGKFIHTFGDVHVYSNHVEALKEQLTRKPYPFPTIDFTGDFTLENLKDVSMDEWCNSFIIKNYECHPIVKMDMAV
jgi:thymidylate synthase